MTGQALSASESVARQRSSRANIAAPFRTRPQLACQYGGFDITEAAVPVSSVSGHWPLLRGVEAQTER